MKKVIFSLLTFFLFVGLVAAQDSPDKALKSAKSSYNKYKVETDDAKKKDKMQTAIESIDFALANIAQIGEKDKVKVYLTAGEIYNEMVQKDVQMMLINPDHSISNPEYAKKAHEVYSKAFDMAAKKYEVKDATTGLQNAASSLTAVSNIHLKDGNYAEAYDAMDGILKIYRQTKAKGEPVVLKTDKEFNDQLYYLGICARLLQKNDAAKGYFKTLIDKNYDNAQIYSNYANILMTENEEAAMAVLKEGREKFPEDVEILFGEINYYIQKQEYDVLKEKLTQAMEAAPDNPSVPSAMGNVYMNLFQKEYDADNMEKADEYFVEAKKYFEKSLEIDPKMFDAVYSIGSLYYNKAVAVSKDMNALGNTREELKKYDQLNEQMKALFKEALPYFKRSEKMNPNDSNTLIALKEIFARMDDLTTSNVFKKRLETVQGGGSNESSYFNK